VATHATTPAQATTPSEIQIHMTVAHVLRTRLREDWLFAHYPAGERHDPRVVAKLKSMGMQVGWPDLILVAPNGIMHSMELKKEGAKLSSDQEEF
jgi:VRR-NUC domain